MVCLESDLLVAFLRKDEEARAFVRSERARGKRFTVSSISVCELFEGAAKRGEEAIRNMHFFIQNADMLPLDARAAELYGRLHVKLKQEGQTIPDLDTLIASTALANNEELATRDEHFRRIPGLRVRKW